MSNELAPDPYDVRLAVRADGLLRQFNEAGVLAAADIHVARRLTESCGEDDEEVRLAIALAVRGPRIGHVLVDLEGVSDTATSELDEAIDVRTLPWPEPSGWVERIRASSLVAVGEEGLEGRPLRLCGSAVYLDRYWREERRLATDLLAFARADLPQVDQALLRDGLGRHFTREGDGRQRMAAAAAVLRRLAVVAGGPGTGKTTTVTRIAALLAEQAQAFGRPRPLVALAAPTGKAAARLTEAMREEAAKLACDEDTQAWLLALEGTTLHRLVGARPGTIRLRHSRSNRLPHDVVIVDESSMVSLSMMARLVEAVRSDGRLILIGDPGQLTSIEAGAVLGDVVGPAARGLRMRRRARERMAHVTGLDVPAEIQPEERAIGDGVVLLKRVHRFGEEIGALAAAIGDDRPDTAIDLLSRRSEAVVWVPTDATVSRSAGALRKPATEAAQAVHAAATAGDSAAAIAALGRFRLLCAHRQGPCGVSSWTERVEQWLRAASDDIDTGDRWYVGRPLLVAENDYSLRLHNGDTGVIVAGKAGPRAAFDRTDGLVELAPERLAVVDTVHAMTIHKSQGSQFETAAVLLPAADSPILTRELLYTAVTRARTRLVLVGPEETIRAAIGRQAARASGLRGRLWASDA